MNNRALIFGVGGQDGSYLAEFLLAKGYSVYGTVRRSPKTIENLQNVTGRVEFIYADMRDGASIVSAISRAHPSEIYNLAAQSFVPPSWVNPSDTLDINSGGLARILEYVAKHKPDTRVYQASSSEMFGNQSGELNENSPMRPTSPYGVSKLAAHHLIQAYRQTGVRCVSGILFNHESPRRGPEMVTRKICIHVARFARGIKEVLELGNISAARDWGFSPDYVEAMWMMTERADADYVIGTGDEHTVLEFLVTALNLAGIEVDCFTSKWLKGDLKLKRQGEIYHLKANADLASKNLGWKPKTTFKQMVEIMVQSEIDKCA